MGNKASAVVCIIVPILNEAKHIIEALDSLVAQNFSGMEVIIYDGGSTDGTIAILKQYPFEVIVEPGLGQMAAINRGWRRTEAEYVTWMAGDDRLKSGAIARLFDEIQSHPEAGAVHAEADLIDGDGKIFGHLSPGNIQFQNLVFEFSLVPQTVLIRRKALDKAGMMDESLKLLADHDLFLRIAQYYPLCYAPFTAADYRLHSGSEDARHMQEMPSEMIRMIEHYFRRDDLTPEQLALRSHGLAGANLFAGTTCCRINQRRKAWQFLGQALKNDPGAVFSTRRGLGLVVRLLIPYSFKPYQLRQLSMLWKKSN